MNDIIKKLTTKYLSLADEHGNDYAKTYIEQVCWKIINDVKQTDSVRNKVKHILDSFLKLEY